MRTLRRGDTGSDVVTLQEALRRAGYDVGTENGVFGPQTEAAVRAFQRVLGLTEDGIVGPRTWAFLMPFVEEPDATVLRRGSRGERVRTLQTALTKSGHYTGGIDGLFGTRTQAAVRAFQTSVGLPVTGVVNAATWQALAPYITTEVPRRTLRRGDSGSDVVTLQEALRRAGYDVGTENGVFGPQTEAAVRAFQRVLGLTVDGIVGPRTWAFLMPFVEEPDATVLRRGSRGARVRILQAALTNSGHYTGEIDGLFGTRTQAAVRAFQTSVGLPATGIVNAATWQALAPFITEQVPTQTFRRGDRGASVMAIQIALRNAGFSPGTIDGIFGTRTEAAVRSFQRAMGLPVTGVADPQTLARLAPFYSGFITYTVQRGDTLTSIARRFNTTVEALLIANPRANPDLIFVGERLIIPHIFSRV